jgi:hypothetical protein
MRRKSFLASIEIFLALLLCAVLLSVVSVERTAFSRELSLAGRAELLDDLLSTWQANGKIYRTVSAGGSDYYRGELASIERSSGEKLCLYLDGLPLYREECRPEICAHRFFARASLLGNVEFRKLEVCYSR